MTEREPLSRDCPRCHAPAGTLPAAAPYRAAFADEDNASHRARHETTNETCAACGSAVEHCQMWGDLDHHRFHHASAFLDLGPLIFRRVCRDYHPPKTCPSCRRAYPLHLFATAINSVGVEGPDRRGVPIWKRVGWWQVSSRHDARESRNRSDFFYRRFGGRLFYRGESTLEACDYCQAMTICAVCHRRYELGDDRTRERWQEFIHTGENNRQAQELLDVLGKDPSARRCQRCGGGEELSAEHIAELEGLAGKR